MQSIHEQQTGITTSIKGKRSGLALLKDNTSNTPISKRSMRKTSDNKENKPLLKKTHAVYMDPKPKIMADKVTQTESVMESDLTDESASAVYWERLAERRGDDLNKSMQERMKLECKVEELQKENEVLEDISNISEHLAMVLQEVLGEDDTTKELIDSISQIREARKTVCEKSMNTSVCDEPSTFLSYDCTTSFNDSV